MPLEVRRQGVVIDVAGDRTRPGHHGESIRARSIASAPSLSEAAILTPTSCRLTPSGTLEKRRIEAARRWTPNRDITVSPHPRRFPCPDPETMEVMAYRVFVTDGQVYEFPDHAAMVIDGSDYVFVVGDDEISRLRVR